VKRVSSGVEQENPFLYSNPNKHGWQGTLGRFPKYMENPPKQLKRKFVDQGAKKELFKYA
jgi:hypothetical protein